MAKKSVTTLLILLVSSTNSIAQIAKTNSLYKTILAQDSLLFSVGFNTCDITQFENLLSDDFKFYHDKDGISDKAKFLRDLKNGLCSNPSRKQVKRILIEESIEIFPLDDNDTLYGAIQNGSHLFYENPESEPGIAKFSHMWQVKNGRWKLSTSLSFDHQPYLEHQSQNPIFEDDASINNWIKQNNIPILGIGIIENGSLQQVKVFGELSEGIAAPYNTIFNVASLTKPLTALVALKLISSGSLDLDEPLYKYWTDQDTATDLRNKKLTTSTPNGADDLLTTIEDYGSFLVHLMNGSGLTKEVYREMISHQVPSTKGKHFGLGIELYDLGNKETAWLHGGSDNGVRTLFIILPKSKKGLLIFTNSDTGTNVYEKLIEHYLGDNGKKIIAIETD